MLLAAKAALRRKKAHEHSLEQTIAQIGTLEQQINAIESANINRETLVAMERAGEAMRQIHGKLTPEKVDKTMYVHIYHFLSRLVTDEINNRSDLQDHNLLSEEISNAITSTTLGEPIDEVDLEEELEQMQQEQLDEQMLKSGTVPVSDAVHRMPAAANGESEYNPLITGCGISSLTISPVKGKAQPVEEDDEEAEFRKLQAEMAM